MVPGGTSIGEIANLTELGLFWVAYLLVIGVLLVKPDTRFVALGFCVVATLLVPVMWLL